MRSGNTSSGGTADIGDGDASGDGDPDDGDDDTLHLLRDGEGGSEDYGDDRNGDMYLSPGSVAISSAISISMAGGRVKGARTLFLFVSIMRTPLGCTLYGR
ncbi:hypothetical protein Tco_1186062 [Tanacetum coccineum]